VCTESDCTEAWLSQNYNTDVKGLGGILAGENV
jgi:hypothetical protein